MPKQKPATKADIKRLENQFKKTAKSSQTRFSKIDGLFRLVDKRFDKVDTKFAVVDKRFDKVEENISELKGNVLNLQLDSKQAQAERTEILKEIKLLQQSITSLDKKVTVQIDIPPRVEQLEQDIYQLKLKSR